MSEHLPTDERFASERWSEGPKAGQKFFRPNSRGYGFVVNHCAETRHVVERTFGGSVIYVSGRKTRYSQHQQDTPEQWNAWVVNARLVK